MRSGPFDHGAVGRKAALRLAREALGLPPAVSWFYLRALRSTVRKEGRSSLCDIEHPAELTRLLELANGSEHVIGFGGRSALSAISLALSEARRHVTIFDPLAEPRDQQEYLRLVDPAVRSRIEFHYGFGEHAARELPVCDLVFVDGSLDREESLLAARCGERIVRRGGLLILRGYRRRELDQIGAGLGLDASVFGGDLVWRKSADWGRRGSSGRTASRSGLPAFALRGVLVGMAAAVLLPASLSETLPGTTGNGREEPASQAKASSGPSSSREQAVSRRSRSRTSIAPSAGRAPVEHRRTPVARGGADTGGVSGTGTKRLGTLRVDRPMTLRWSTRDRSFVIVSDDWRFRPRQRHGTTLLSPGTYRRFTVKATKRWKLRLRPVAQ